MPLLLFNLGIEVGQIFIVILFMATLTVYTKMFNGTHSKWNQFVSGAGFGIATIILHEALKEEPPEVPQLPPDFFEGLPAVQGLISFL